MRSVRGAGGRLGAWFGQVQTLPDWLSLSRLVLTGPIWAAAIGRRPRLVAGLVAVAATTDVLDGALARLSGQRSTFGSQLDTIADSAVILSAPTWIELLYPEAFQRRKGPVVVLLMVAAGILAVEWRKFRRFGNLHIHSTRAASVAAHFYVLNLLLRGRDEEALFDLFLILAGGAVAEIVVVLATRESLDELTETPLLEWVVTRGSRAGVV